MKIDIDNLSYDELIDLNHRIVERLKFLDQMQAHSQMLEFSIGEKVEFAPHGRDPIAGVIVKYNRKTVTVVTEQGQKWRVGPELLRKVTTVTKSTGNVVPIKTDRE